MASVRRWLVNCKMRSGPNSNPDVMEAFLPVVEFPGGSLWQMPQVLLRRRRPAPEPRIPLSVRLARDAGLEIIKTGRGQEHDHNYHHAAAQP